MWFAGLTLPVWSVLNVGVAAVAAVAVARRRVTLIQGRIRPRVPGPALEVLAIIPTKGALSWQVVQAGTFPATVV